MHKSSILLTLRRPRLLIGLVAVVSAAATIAMLVTAGYPDSAPRLMWIFTAVTAVMTAIATLLAIVTQTRNDGKK